MGIKLGMDARLYRNNGGDWTTPVWAVINNVKDVTLNLDSEEADVTTRGNYGWKATMSTLRDGTIDFEMVWDSDDAGFTALQQAYFNKTSIIMLALDDAVTVSGAQGLKALFAVKNFSRNEPLSGAITANVSIRPTYSANAPTWYTVT